MACSFITLNWILALECKLIWYVGKESFSVSENIKKCTTMSNNLKSQARMTPGGEHGSVWNHDVRGSLCVCVCVCSRRLQRISLTSLQSRGRRSSSPRLMTLTKSFRRHRTKGEGSMASVSDRFQSLFLITFVHTGVEESFQVFFKSFPLHC